MLKSTIPWIVCSDEEPTKTGRYLTTHEIPKTGERFVGITYFYKESGWANQILRTNIIAWQQLPEPY